MHATLQVLQSRCPVPGAAKQPHNIKDPAPCLTVGSLLCPYTLCFAFCKQIVRVHCQKAPFLFCLSKEHFLRRIAVCPGLLCQKSVVPLYVFSSAVGSSLAFVHKALLGLVCGVWYVWKPLPPHCSRSAFRPLDVLHCVYTSLQMLLSSIFLLPPSLGTFLIVLNCSCTVQKGIPRS